MRFLKTLAHSLKAALLATVAASSVPAHAQTGKPIRMVHTAAAGSMSDTFTRVVAEGLASRLQQAVIVDAKPGASGIIASQDVARSAPDGNTLLLGTMSSHVLNPILLNPPYDAVNDFAPVALLAITPLVLVANPSMPGNLDELLAVVRREPNKVSFATWGNATLPHLAAELLMSMTKTAMIHVPYKGGAPAVNDTLAGNVDMLFAVLPEALPHIQAGKLHALALMAPRRAAMLPNTPTMAEGGFADLNLSAWVGLFAPAKTPQPVIDKLNRAVRVALDSEIKTKLGENGMEVAPSTPEQLRQTVAQDIRLHAELVKAAGIQPQ